MGTSGVSPSPGSFRLGASAQVCDHLRKLWRSGTRMMWPLLQRCLLGSQEQCDCTAVHLTCAVQQLCNELPQGTGTCCPSLCRAILPASSMVLLELCNFSSRSRTQPSVPGPWDGKCGCSFVQAFYQLEPGGIHPTAVKMQFSSMNPCM